ncbi:MAG: tRNA (adenosine(37)-N6)-dimethylallyltransferase MiaA [Lachnospiraceae bacterium]|nr:tRNA (adenosine(37)-N6)-dimethylallyltransferase MiaA [Lachnospiraceae bacterium]
MKNKVVIITGPTSVGKTSLSIELAKRINGEIISADSMQVYKYMDIGSAKIKPSEMDNIKHHLIDILEPTVDFNVYLFQKMAKEAMDEIYQNGHIPIIVGGTGFYIQALLYDITFDEEDNSAVRKKYEDLLKERGCSYLYNLLKEKDPKYADTLHENNSKKVIRALEYIELNNKLFSQHNEEERKKESPYDFSYFVLNDDRDKLYENIEKRVDIMVKEGLLEEVKSLHDKGYTKSMNSMQGLGYKEILDYLDNKCSFEEAIDKIKLETRHFAKRQLTWFRREKKVTWINKPDFSYNNDKILEFMIGEINHAGN